MGSFGVFSISPPATGDLRPKEDQSALNRWPSPQGAQNEKNIGIVIELLGKNYELLYEKYIVESFAPKHLIQW